jgi:hypothetical protein
MHHGVYMYFASHCIDDTIINFICRPNATDDEKATDPPVET